MKGIDLKGGSRSIGDKAWQNFLTADATVGFDAFVLTYDARAQILETYVKDLNDAEIPIICFPAASPDGEADAALTLGFLFGGNSEKLGVKYADIYNEVLDHLESKLGSLQDADKTNYLAMTMYTSVCQNDSTYQLCGLAAHGVPYNRVDSEFAAKYGGTSSTTTKSVEVLSNLNMKRILDFRSMDQTTSADEIKQVIIDTFEYTNSNGVQLLAMLKNSKLYDGTADTLNGVYLVNNVIPAPARVAYSAAVLYDDITMEWANGIMQKFIDEKFTSYDGRTIDNNIVTIFSYDDYKKAKA
jgi:hypothetical protein